MAAKILSKQSKIGILRQPRASNSDTPATIYECGSSTDYQWTNPAAADDAFKTIIYNAGSVNPNPDVQIDQYNVTSQNGSLKEYERFYIDNTSGLPTISFAGPADQNTLAAHLAAAFQPPDGFEAAGTPYEKTYQIGAKTGPIDFRAASATAGGYLHTIAVKPGSSADDGMLLKNALLETFTLGFDFNGRGIGRLAQISGTWIGNQMLTDQSLSGSWVASTIAPFNTTETYSFSTLTIGGVSYIAQCVRRFDFTINNGVASNCRTTGGKANQYDLTPIIKSTIILDWDSATEKILGDYQEGVLVAATFVNDISTGTDRSIAIAGSYGKLMSNPYVYNGEFIGIACDVEWYSNGGLTPITMLYSDTVDWGYEA